MPHKNDLDKLKEKLESFEKQNKSAESQPTPLGALMNAGIELVSGVLVGVGIGLLIDWTFSTKPWGLIVFFALGSIAGMLNLYRALTKKGND